MDIFLIIVVALGALVFLGGRENDLQKKLNGSIRRELSDVPEIQKRNIMNSLRFNTNHKLSIGVSNDIGSTYVFLCNKDTVTTRRIIIPQFLPSEILWEKIVPRSLLKTYMVDAVHKKLCIIQRHSSNSDVFNYSVLEYKDIISVDFVEHNNQTTNTITSTNRGNQIAGTLIGGALLGGVGAIIGGTTAKKTSKSITTTSINGYELVLSVANMQDPIHNIVFQNLFKDAKSTAQHWYGIFSTMIHESNQEQQNLQIQNQQTVCQLTKSSNQTSYADELQKLIKLRDEGVLSDEEFVALKHKVIGPNCLEKNNNNMSLETKQPYMGQL